MARLNLRDGRDYSKIISIKVLWLREQYQRLRKIFSREEISDRDLQKYLVEKYEERYLPEGRFYSQITNENVIMTPEQFADIFFNNPYSLTGYGTLFEDPDSSTQIIIEALEYLADQRSYYKNLMMEQPYGSRMFTYYNTNQITFKLLGNSYYGITGASSSIFFSPMVQNSITLTGQDLTTNAMMFIESFIGDGFKHPNVDSVLRVIREVESEERKHNILDYVERPISLEELINSMEERSEKGFDESGKEIIKKYLKDADEELLTRIYYKNKFNEFFNNKKPLDLFNEIISSTFNSSVTGELKEKADFLTELIMEFVYLDIIIEDRYRRILKYERNVVVGSDTDSVFTNFGEEVNKFTKALNLDPDNKEQQMSIVNLLIHITSTGMDRYMDLAMVNFGVKEKYRPIISMKPEYLYQRMLFTRNKKQYSGLITAKLGKPLSKPDLDIKGLDIRKTNVSKQIRDEYSDLLMKDILEVKEINLKNILDKINKLSDNVEADLRSGGLSYSIPKNISAIDTYVNPSQEEQIRGMLVWNALYPDEMIVAPDKVNFLKINPLPISSDEWKNLKKVNEPLFYRLLKATQGGKNSIVLENVEKEYIETYGKEEFSKLIRELKSIDDISIDISRFGFNALSIPKSVEFLPEELRPFVNYDLMLSNTLKSGYILLESLGIRVNEHRNVNYRSNIVEI